MKRKSRCRFTAGIAEQKTTFDLTFLEGKLGKRSKGASVSQTIYAESWERRLKTKIKHIRLDY